VVNAWQLLGILIGGLVGVAGLVLASNRYLVGIIEKRVSDLTDRVDTLRYDIGTRITENSAHAQEREEALERHVAQRLDTITADLRALGGDVKNVTQAQNNSIRELASLGNNLRDAIASELRDVRADLRGLVDRVSRVEQRAGGAGSSPLAQ
jgi:hypothetical protein